MTTSRFLLLCVSTLLLLALVAGYAQPSLAAPNTNDNALAHTVAQYDKDDDGIISISELFDAIDDYFDGVITISELFDVVDYYFSPPEPAPGSSNPPEITGVIRTSLGRTMDVTVTGFADNRLRFGELESIISQEEQLLGVPFPAPTVTMRKVEIVPGGFCGINQPSYEPRYSSDPYTMEAVEIHIRVDDKCTDTLGTIAHEAAHTWFHWAADEANWIDEGLANSIEIQMKELYLEGQKYPSITYCPHYRNIRELELATPERDTKTGFLCHYRLGDGVFGALREHYGTEEFNRRIARLARRAVNEMRTAWSIEDVRAALGQEPEARQIIDEWYMGEPEMRVFRHLNQVDYEVPPTIDGEYIYFKGKTERLGMVRDFVLGDDPYCPQFVLYQGLGDLEYVASVADPLLPGWQYSKPPKVVVINSDVDPATGVFWVVARINDPSIPTFPELSLKVGSRETKGQDGICEDDINFSWVRVTPGRINDELKEERLYHADAVEWAQEPRVEGLQLVLEGRAEPGTLSFEYHEDFCSQLVLYRLELTGYHLIDSINPLLQDGYKWTMTLTAEVTEAQVYGDGKFRATVKIWDEGVLAHDRLVLVVWGKTEKDRATNTCQPGSEILSAIRIN